jgi:hypothetical protein
VVDAISELIVFGVAGLCISLEVYRNLRSSEISRLAQDERELREKQVLPDFRAAFLPKNNTFFGAILPKDSIFLRRFLPFIYLFCQAIQDRFVAVETEIAHLVDQQKAALASLDASLTDLRQSLPPQ